LKLLRGADQPLPVILGVRHRLVNVNAEQLLEAEDVLEALRDDFLTLL